MRLIDVDALIEFIDVGHLRHPGEFAFSEVDIINMLNHALTAFDVEKILNELKYEESEALRRYSESKGTAYAFSDKCSCDNWAKAIEIVKRGGIDENNKG